MEMFDNNFFRRSKT